MQLHIHIPLLSTEKTLSQLAFYNYSLKAFEESKLKPTLKVFLNKPIQSDLMDKWGSALKGIQFLDCGEAGKFGHLDAAFFDIAAEADVIAFSRSQGFFTSAPDAVAEEVLAKNGIAGVVAFAPFPSKFANPQKAWDKIFEALSIDKPAYDYNYTHRPKVKIPYYLNMGLVWASASMLREMSTKYQSYTDAVKPLLLDPFYSYQVGLSTLIAHHGIAHLALPLQFNYPNDDIPLATRDFDQRKLSFCHYFRDKAYNNESLLLNQETFYDFIYKAGLYRSDKVIQDAMKAVSEGIYPF